MADQRIVHYIRQELNEGFTREQIANALRMQGYSEKDIADAIAAASTVKVPKHFRMMPHPVRRINFFYHRNLIIGVSTVMVVVVLGVFLATYFTRPVVVPVTPKPPALPEGEEKTPVVEKPMLFGSYDPMLLFLISELDSSDYVEDYTYEYKPKNEFRLGEDVYLYVKVQGFKYELQDDGRYHVNIYESIETKKDGEVVSLLTIDELPDSRINNIVEDYERKNEFEFRNILRGRLFEPGDYDVTVKIHDDVTGDVAERTVRFSVR
ncbi:hypothetical protein DRJ17_04920 [Candidatus Woesearchaeota archaeon]|nr:MAG: hypothetical protein DRJ17_04920 [Candidatus Woesearchaeota archaeon]